MFQRIFPRKSISSRLLPALLLISALGPWLVQGGDVLTTDGFSKCPDTESIKITKVHIKYDKAKNVIDFDVAGISTKEQNVTAILEVYAYGRKIEQKKFDPCEEKIQFLCPGMRSSVHVLTLSVYAE